MSLLCDLCQDRAATTWVIVVHVGYTTEGILSKLRFRYTEFLDQAVIDNLCTLTSKEDVALYATSTLISIPRD